MSDAASLGALPTWDLADLYPSPDGAELAADLDSYAEKASAFRAAFEGRVSALTGAELGAAIAEFEAVEEVLGRVMSYAHLRYAGDMSDPEIGKFYQSMQERVNGISTELLFFTLEINRIDEA